MNRKNKSFDDRFLSKIGKIDRSHIREYLAHTLSQKQFLETLFDHLDEGIIVTDADLRVIHSNGVARRMLQWPRAKHYLGESLAQHCPEGDLRVILDRMQARPRPIEGQECAFGTKGERRLVLKAIPMEPGDEEAGAESAPAPMWVFLFQDVTERYRTLEEQARAQRLASLALLTAGIAHEIKNPLNSLNIHAEILLKQARAEEGEPLDRKKVARAASVILEETERLTGIVNVFIQAARPQGPILERNSVNRVCEDIIRVLGPECEQSGVTLRADLDPDLPLILLDIHLMFQALRNLVRNALEAHQEAQRRGGSAAGEGADAPTIVVRTRLIPGAVTIDVVDNGPGIPEDKLDKIFEPYFSTKFDGTGLGLMVVYRVVTEHHGVIHVDSRPGVGTRFKISLPLTERPLRLLEEPRAASAGVA